MMVGLILNGPAFWHNSAMSNYTAQPSPELVIAEPRPPLDYRRIEIVDPQMAGIFRSKSVMQRLELVQQAHRTAQYVVAMGVRIQHPEMISADVQQEVARRLLRGTD